MLNIHDLEKRWKVYKIKSFIPYVITIALLVIVSIAYILYNEVQKLAQQKELSKTKETKITIPLKKLKPTIENNRTKKATAIQTLKPSKGFMKKEQRVAITIERGETKNDVFEVVKRFRKSGDPALSLFVAKKYYELGDYKQAYNYALITNQINPDIEESWIIFAKTLVKLHKKNKAIYTLEEYIKVSHSSNAEILLHEIKSGKFQ
ncbi:MAG TPA: hypothetical protein EYH11_07155 [Sulfurimonas autotrophica]|nr:hypothetical protein [Sulfurimonas autotrophica]